MGSRFRSLSIATLGLVPGLAVAQENLLPNPDFDLDIAGWTAAADGEIDWDPTTDWQNDPSSGSMSVLQTTGGTSAGIARTGCLELEPGRDVELGGRFHVPSGQAGTPHVQMSLSLYAGDSCADSPLIGYSTTNTAVLDEWFEKWTYPTIPADTASGRVTVSVWNGNASSFKARGDGLYLRYLVVFADDFESGDSTAWSDTVIPLVAYGTKTLYDGDSYDFFTGDVGLYSGGDLYFRTASTGCDSNPATISNNLNQGEGRFLSSLTAPLSAFTAPSSGYTILSVCLALNDVYVYTRGGPPGSFVFFRVVALEPTHVTLEYEVR